jgi:hypothetical protein
MAGVFIQVGIPAYFSKGESMARRDSLVIPSDEGYPRCRTHDGIDLTVPVGGYQNDALVVSSPVEKYTNSKTGEPMEAPDYSQDEPSRARRKGIY